MLMTYISFAQCVADAGPDKVVCTGLGFNDIDSTSIGGNPTASFGVPPYTYTWSAYYEYDVANQIFIYTASDFLNDTSVANPVLKETFHDDLDFYLTVTDANNNVCRDTVRIRFSFFYGHLAYFQHYITEGDSVKLDYNSSNVGGGIGPLSFVWQPQHGLSDSTSQVVWAKPTQNEGYYLRVTDSAGCVAEGGTLYYIIVYPVSVSELLNNSALSIYPNPTSDFVSIKSENLAEQKFTFSMFNVQGALVYSKEVDASEKINLELFPSGMYIYQISQGDETLGQGKLVRE